MHLTSCETLVILITSFGEFLLYFIIIFFFHLKKIKKNSLQDCFWCCLVLPYFYCRIECSVGLNCDQMEMGEQYSEYLMEGNPSAYVTMRDYRNLPWQWQQPVERNPNPYRSMREYRDQWMSAPVYNVPSTYIPPASPHFTSTPQPQQPPPLSPVEQAILNLSKQVDNFIEDNRVVNVQANREIETVEGSLNKELDGFESEIDQKLDILQESISKLANQFFHQEEENLEEECLTDIILGEEAQLQGLKEEPIEDPEELQDAPQLSVIYGPWKKEEEILPLLSEESNGNEPWKSPKSPLTNPKTTHCQ